MRNQGFTLIELLLTVAIIAVLLVTAVPSVREQMLIENIRAVGNNLKQELSYARSEAIKRNTDIFIDVITSDGGASWCVGISVNNNCDCTVSDPVLANACVLPVNGTNILRVLNNEDYTNVVMDSEHEFDFDRVRGTASNAGSFVFEVDAYEARVTISLLGRVRLCDVNGNLSGWTAC